VSVVVVVTPWKAAEMVTVPFLCARARPAPLMCAIEGLDVCQLIPLVIARVEPSLYCPVRVKFSQVPLATVEFAGLMLRLLIVAVLICRAAVPEIEPILAVTFKLPGASPVATPELLIVAKPPLEETQMATELRSWVLVSS
jgi:hypothetical protein